MYDRNLRGTPAYLITKKVQRIVASMAYPEIVAYLHSIRGVEQTKNDLKDIAYRIADQIMEVWRPKTKSIKKLIIEAFELLGDKIQVKMLEKDRQGRPKKICIIDKDCILCPPEIRGVKVPKELPMCIVVSYFLEKVFQILIERQILFKFYYDPSTTTAIANTISSRSAGDKYCEHHLSFTFGDV